MTTQDARRLLAASLCAGLAGCGLFGDSRPSLSKVDDLVERIEHVHVETELAREAARTAVSRLATLTSPTFTGNPVQTHADLVTAVEASERQAERLREGVSAMQGAAGPVFDQWRQDLDAIVSARVRTRSEQRMRETRERYEAILASVRPALEEYEALNRSVRDLALFLGHDFNRTAVEAVEEDVRALETQVAALDDQLEGSLMAARTYLDGATRSGPGIEPDDGLPAEPPAR